jgi:hypothetical protein
VGCTEKSFIVMSQQVSMDENGYFLAANGGSLQHRVLTNSVQTFMECMENPFMVLCKRGFVMAQYVEYRACLANFSVSLSYRKYA